MDNAQLTTYTVEMLGNTLPLEWTDPNGRHISILRIGYGKLYQNDIIKSADSGNMACFKVLVDGKYHNGDGWYVFPNPPIAVWRDDVIHVDTLEAFFEIIEQAVS